MLCTRRAHLICLKKLHQPTSRHTSSLYIRRAQFTTSATKELESFQFLPNKEKNGEAEDVLFTSRVKELKQWWGSPRFNGLKRPYSAEDVASKQGSLQQSYPSSAMARKLFTLLSDKAEMGLPLHTSTMMLLSL